MSKKQLVNGVSIKVDNRSGFDKGYFNALTTHVGTITPLVKQLMLPNSSGSCRITISAQLPPLASDCFLRSHLKLEAFFVPLRLCYGGFESWFCGREVYDANNNAFIRAKLPNLLVMDYANSVGSYSDGTTVTLNKAFGTGSLLDYFGVYWKSDVTFATRKSVSLTAGPTSDDLDVESFEALNIFPHICYGLIYDEYYRNKFVEKPLFAPPAARSDQSMTLEATALSAYNLPYVSSGDPIGVVGASDAMSFGSNAGVIKDNLLNGRLVDLRQRNYGDDYFTAAMPNAGGESTTISIVNNKFSIGALRLGNALAEFEDANNYASPDYLQTLSARYGASLSAGIAQKPILLGSADFPMYTSGVEQTNAHSVTSIQYTTNNPFQSVGARYGRGHVEGSDFVCKFNVDEPGYFMVMASLVPEAQYYQGIARDMQILVSENGGDSLTDLPCGLLESIGNDAIFENELLCSEGASVFGYVQRYLWHKLGNRNQVHGLFRKDESLGSFVVQRGFDSISGINSSFLKVKPSDLDNVASITGQISEFGCMIDSKIDLFVSEPLTESAIPALANPAHEHGRTVYVKTGGSKLA